MSTGNRRGKGRSGGGGGGGKGGKHRQPQSREVTISKALSFLLRHGAKDEGVQLDEGGWANVRDVVCQFPVLICHRFHGLFKNYCGMLCEVSAFEKTFWVGMMTVPVFRVL